MKKLYILILFLIAVFIVVFFTKGTSQSVNFFEITQFINNAKIEKEYIIRVYNQHPSGDPLSFKEGTRFLLNNNIYLLKEDYSISGLDESGNPGYVDVVVVGEDDIEGGSNVFTIPGLTGTEYEKTTWAELEPEEEEDEKEFYIENKVNGVIEGDTVWDSINSPYMITGNILIPEGVTLIIEPGTEIVFDGEYSFLIEGELIFSGKKKNTIKLYGARNNMIGF